MKLAAIHLLAALLGMGQPPAQQVHAQPGPGSTDAISDTNAADGYVEPHPYFLLSRDTVARFDRLSLCESGGDWTLNTGNGYFGGIQFSLSSWRAVGGEGYPNEASREEQVYRGHLLQSDGGWRHWPGCSRSFGWIS